MSRLPNFIVAGFPKCGTSSLYQYIKHHPEIYLPQKKELHYFTNEYLSQSLAGPGDVEVHKYHIKHIDDYLTFYAKVKDEKMVGDVSPSYISFSDCIPKIKEEIGDIKVIVLLRDPIDRLYSNYLHLIREDREKLSLKDALQKENERYEKGFSNFWRYKHNSFYSDKIASYKENFKDVLVLPFEEYINDLDAGLETIYEFLGVDKTFKSPTMGKKFNEGGLYEKNPITKFLHGRNRIKDIIKRIAPVDLASLKATTLSRFRKKTPKIETSIVNQLIPEFTNDVKRLSEEFGINTSYWRNYNEIKS